MRKKYLIGNWKMNMSRDESLEFIFNVSTNVPNSCELKTVICPPYLFLRTLVKRQGDNLAVGAQNVHFNDSGAFTGEVSSSMIKSVGVEYVIIGHSERRSMFNETDDTVNKKIKSALDNDLTPILCVGESLETRESNSYKEFIKLQIIKALDNLNSDEIKKIIIAYEPIWAIGTGKTASSLQAEEVCSYIRDLIKDNFNYNESSILYGGSASTKNVDELFSKDNIDGFLVGGASLKSESYLEMANKIKKQLSK